ncbi:MAG: outer membrane beta-barrel protein [Verrucomicrobiales bacterium]|nr:outer membrane beta-barrel protein [Verrucomicrobiales bacterium]
MNVQAQEALRESLSASQMAAARHNAIRNRDYNLALGPVDLLFDAGFSAEWNDNVRLQSEGASLDSTEPEPGLGPPRRLAGLQDGSGAKNSSRTTGQATSPSTHSGVMSDFIFRPTANMHGVWPITELNTLYFSIGTSYQKYLRESQLDRFTIAPESHTAFDIYVGDVALTFYDKFSFNTDPLSEGSVSGVGDYGRMENTAGLTAAWDLNAAILSGGYSHLTSLSTSPQFEYTDHATDMFYLRSSFKPHPAVIAGLDSSLGLNRYDQQLLTDSVNYTFGAFVNWEITDSIRAQANAGYSIYDFDQGSGLFLVDDVDGMYFDLTVSHLVNRWMSHQLNAARSFRVGINSDIQDTYRFGYTATLQFIRDLAINLDAAYELGNEPFFLESETYRRYLVGAGTSYQLMEKLRASLAYRFTTKTSDTAIRDYHQNQVTLTLNYKF